MLSTVHCSVEPLHSLYSNQGHAGEQIYAYHIIICPPDFQVFLPCSRVLKRLQIKKSASIFVLVSRNQSRYQNLDFWLVSHSKMDWFSTHQWGELVFDLKFLYLYNTYMILFFFSVWSTIGASIHQEHSYLCLHVFLNYFGKPSSWLNLGI